MEIIVSKTGLDLETIGRQKRKTENGPVYITIPKDIPNNGRLIA